MDFFPSLVNDTFDVILRMYSAWSVTTMQLECFENSVKQSLANYVHFVAREIKNGLFR